MVKLKKAIGVRRKSGQTLSRKHARVDFSASGLHPSVLGHDHCQLIVVGHLHRFLCTVLHLELQWLFEALKKEYRLKNKHMLEPGSGGQVAWSTWGRVGVRPGAWGTLDWACGKEG